MGEENMTRTVQTLDVTNSVPENRLIVGLMGYINDMMGLDYENIAEQLEYVAKYARSQTKKGN